MYYYIKTYNEVDALKALAFLKQFADNPYVKIFETARRISLSSNYYDTYSRLYSNKLRYCDVSNSINLVTNNENLNTPRYTELFRDDMIDEC